VSSILFVVLQKQEKNRNWKMTFCTYATSSLVVNHLTWHGIKSLCNRLVMILYITCCFCLFIMESVS